MTLEAAIAAAPAVRAVKDGTYLLPIRKPAPEDLSELGAYLEGLSMCMEVIVVDGSSRDLFEAHAALWPACIHVAPEPAMRTANGKVWGVLTGMALASHDKVIIADEDVRYDLVALARTLALLDEAEVVRPQNYFDPTPWHAQWDTARTLLNRAFDGDWPGTLAVRRSVLAAANGYDGDTLFENLELVRTVEASGGRQLAPLDLFVARRPSSFRHFLSQRVRQAYDEFARPQRLALQLSLLPAALLCLRLRPGLLLPAAIASVLLAEYGRVRGGGHRVFSFVASLMAPLWLSERALCSWLAVVSRLRYGGVRYHGGIVTRAATSPRELKARLRASEQELRK